MTPQAFLKRLFSQPLFCIFALILLISFTSAQEVTEEEAEVPQEYDSSYDYEDYIMFHWKGALTSHSITFKVFPIIKSLTDKGYNTYLASYTKPTTPGSAEDLADEISGFDNVNITKITFSETAPHVGTFILENLNADSFYYYSFFFTTQGDVTRDIFKTDYESDEAEEFTFTTLGMALNPYSFTFGASCCAQTNSTSPVFQTLTNKKLDFFIHLGDMHDQNITKNDTTEFFNAYNNTFNTKNQKKFFQNTPFFFIWDDNDFGTSDANGKSATRDAAILAYNNYVPHRDLRVAFPEDDATYFPEKAPQADNSKDGYVTYTRSAEISGNGIFQSFIVGRTLFIMVDLISYKDLEASSILGTDQKNWLKNQLIFVSKNTALKQVFLVSNTPWIHTAGSTEWQQYEAEQKTIGEWVKTYVTNKGKKLMMLSGHTRMIAFDSGKNNAYGGFPVLQAGSLDQDPSCEGGPYSHGLYKGREQYAIINVVDNNTDTVCVQLSLERAGDPLIVYDTCTPDKYKETEMSCPAESIGETIIKGASSYWLIILIGIGIIAIVAYLGMRFYRQSKGERLSEDPERDVSKYMEMTESKKKQNEIL